MVHGDMVYGGVVHDDMVYGGVVHSGVVRGGVVYGCVMYTSFMRSSFPICVVHGLH